jgi:hypothetical protein
MITHRLKNGDWAECLSPEGCELKFHLPGMSPAEAAGLPFSMMLPLLGAIDPPDIADDSGQRWVDSTGNSHRDYDLPAIIWSDGSMEWNQHGLRHRDNDQPAVVWHDGRTYWYTHGVSYLDRRPSTAFWEPAVT